MLMLCVGFSACVFDDDRSCSLTCSKSTPEVVPPLVSAVPDTLFYGANRLILQASTWRDFEPALVGDPCVPIQQALATIALLVDVDSVAISTTVALEHIWVLHGDEWWSAEFASEPGRPAP